MARSNLPARARRLGLPVAPSLALGALLWPTVAATDPAMPGPARSARPADAVAENRACESCHPEIAAEWRASMHKQAHTDPAYQRALAIEPLSFCRGCHAPEADPRAEAPPASGDIGVACVSCHDAAGKPPLSAPRSGGPEPPHAVRRSARFATGDACASCHEFPFPGQPPAGLRMQTTMSEHRASDSADRTCASCHMPWVGAGAARHRSHRFEVRDPRLLRGAMSVRARRAGATAVELTLEPVGVGHAFPTGDLFRRIAVEAEVAGPDNLVLASASRYLTRHFENLTLPGGRHEKRLVRDDRPGTTQGPSGVVLDLGQAGLGQTILYRVTYERVAHPAGVSEATAIIETSVILAEGAVKP